MSSQPKLMELRPDRSLLNSNFDGYKLSLTPISAVTEQLKITVDRLVPDINQYSLLHAKLYAFHNHLIGDADDPNSVYLIDKQLNVQKFTLEANYKQLCGVSLWQIPLQRDRRPGDYNASLKFASDTIAVAADGMGCLYVLDRGCQDVEDKWKVIFSGDVTADQPFVITDVLHRDIQEPELHLLLTSIRPRESNERHSTILHWITLAKTDTWNQVALRELTVNSFVQYSNFERSADAVYVVSDSGCKFTLDSENEICATPENQVEKSYKWSQSEEDVTVKFQLPEGGNKNLVTVETESARVKVKYDNDTLLEGPLYKRVQTDTSCWTISDNTLELVLQKCETGQMWTEIVEGDMRGEYIPDPTLLEEITERLAPLTSEDQACPPTGTTFNSQQVEECDFESDKLTVFERLDCNSHKVTHKTNLGSHQVLLTVNVDGDLPLALGTRSDVDACIWQPIKRGDDFCLEHKGTLLALGYIQASKQVKFFTCSPDLSYSVICESTKHVFIYCQQKKVDNELRQRTTGCRINTLAQQQVFALPLNEEILGLYASNTHLYVLGESFITALQI